MMNPTFDKISKEFFDSARQATRFGLKTAGNALCYTANMLRDLEKELRETGERIGKQNETPCATDTIETPKA
jgi:hypothetical protein